jgi:hypothetical protein
MLGEESRGSGRDQTKMVHKQPHTPSTSHLGYSQAQQSPAKHSGNPASQVIPACTRHGVATLWTSLEHTQWYTECTMQQQQPY